MPRGELTANSLPLPLWHWTTPATILRPARMLCELPGPIPRLILIYMHDTIPSSSQCFYYITPIRRFL